MFKKMLSTILVAMLILSIFAVMPAMAAVDEVGTVYYRDDFENYTLGTTANSRETLANSWLYNKDGNARWETDGSIGAEIVSVEGYDGEMTQAMKIVILRNSEAYDNGNRRIYLRSFSGYEAPTSGLVINEFKIKLNNIKQFTGLFRKENTGGAINVFAKGSGGSNTIGSYYNSSWVKIKVVRDIETGNTVTYINDVMTTYNKINAGTANLFFYQFGNIVGTTYDTSEPEDYVPGVDYILVDDMNLYYAPEAATPVATYPANNETGVTFATNPSVTFNVPLMNAVETLSNHADAVLPENAAVTPENVTVEVIECADESKLGEIEAAVTLSNENKTLNIEPAKEFPGNAKIRVTVSGLRDDMDRDVAETSFEFTTMEQVELTGELAFRKENLVFSEGAEITALQNGYISCDYTLTNAENASAVDVLFFAVLKVDGVVEGFQFKPATVGANGGTATFQGGFNVTDAANSSIEVYVWDGFQNMASFVRMVSFDANGLTTAQ